METIFLNKTTLVVYSAKYRYAHSGGGGHFSGRTDFIVVCYSATNSGLPSNNRFIFRDNVVKVNRIWGSMWNVFLEITSLRVQLKITDV
jgi:hypothetical protein